MVSAWTELLVVGRSERVLVPGLLPALVTCSGPVLGVQRTTAMQRRGALAGCPGTVDLMAAVVSVVFDQHLPLPADEVFALLCDWEDHARWIPFTRVDLHASHHFTALTGVWPLRLRDEMVVVSRNDAERRVRVRKLGPVLTGEARFAVREIDRSGSIVTWEEHVRVPLLPGFTAPMLRSLTRWLFRRSLRRLPPRS